MLAEVECDRCGSTHIQVKVKRIGTRDRLVFVCECDHAWVSIEPGIVEGLLVIAMRDAERATS